MIFDFLLAATLLASLTVYNPKRIDGEEFLAFSVLMLLTIYSLFLKRKREVNFVLPAAMLGLALFTVSIRNYWIFQGTLSNVFVWMLTALYLAERIDDRSEKVFSWTLLLSNVISNVFIVWQVVGRDPFYNPVYEEVAGTSLLPWILGSTAVLTIPFIYSLSPWTCLTVLPMIFFSQSKACALIGAFVFLIMVSKNNRKILPWAAAVVALAAVAYPFVINDEPNFTRFIIWKKTLKYSWNHLWGSGIGTWCHMGFKWHAPGDFDYHWRTAHNEPYQYYFEQGQIGICLLSALLWRITVSSSLKMRASLFGVVALSFVHPIFHFGRLAVILCIVFAIALKERAIFDTSRKALSQPKKQAAG